MNSRALVYVFAAAVLIGMVGVSTWAASIIGIGDSIADLVASPAAGNNPWLVATLFDAYFGFLWFWLWIAWREPTWTRRLVWLVLLLGLGNIAMAVYAILALRSLPADLPASALLSVKARG